MFDKLEDLLIRFEEITKFDYQIGRASCRERVLRLV